MSLEFEMPLVSTIFVLILGIVYFSKPKINLLENKYYSIIIILSFIECLLSLFAHLITALNSYDIVINQYYDVINIINMFVSTIFVGIFTALSCYVLFISNENAARKEKYIRFFYFGFLFIFFVTTCFTKIEIIKIGTVTNIRGSTIMLSYIFTFIFLLISIIISIFNREKLDIRYASIFIIFVIMTISYFVTLFIPGIILYDFALALLCYIMYFTIENPDVKMVEQLEIAKDAADRANRAKTDFLSSMSHEIRTPLNAISGFSDCIMNADSLDEAKENAKDIVDASNTLIEIVNGILDVSKIEAGKMDIVSSPYNTHDVFNELAKLITPRMNEKGIDFSYYMAPDIPKTLYGDHANIKKIVTNLLSNACKYTDSGFVKYEVNCVNMKNYTRLIISVEDSGRGIKKQNIDKMFTKFQRLEEDKNTTIEGTGLGLAITKQLTELMGGKIIVHTVYGKGSKFTVVINQKLTDKEVEEEKQYKTTLNLENIKILLVDDNQLNIKVARKLLEGYNANLITACESGFECFDIISKGEKFDIILLDDMMPKMSGIDTLHKLKEIPGFNIPTVALTANAITGMKEKYLAEGFTDYLAKPIEKEELVRVINQILGRVVTEQIPVVSDEANADKEVIEDDNNINDIIPVEENIEELLGKKLDLSNEVDTHFDEALVHVDHINEDVEILDDTKEIETIPVVDIDIPTERLEKVDVNYLKDNGVDVDHALELLGDMDMYNSTINDFLLEIDDKWNRIVEYKNNSDMDNYAIEVHSLKSDSKYLGLMKLADIAYQHELKSKENDIDYVNSNFDKLENELKKDLEIIKEYKKNN